VSRYEHADLDEDRGQPVHASECWDLCETCGDPLEDGCCVVIECPVYQLEVHGGPSVMDAPALPAPVSTVTDLIEALKRSLGGA
jgi:hypothetical protein